MFFSLPRKECLKGKTSFDALFSDGKSIHCHPIRVHYLKTHFKDGSKIKIAVSAPKKKFKNAVTRNRIKRLLRESYRLNKPDFFNKVEGNYALLFLYLGKTMPKASSLERDMKKAMSAFIKKEFHD